MLAIPLHALALAPPPLGTPTGLSIAEIKMTGDEFVVLQNNTGANIDTLAAYALYYFNKFNPFDPGVGSSIKALPAVALPAGGSIMLSSAGAATCGAVAAGDLGISLGDGSGFLEVVKLGSQNGAVVQEAGDMVSWDSKANGIIQNVPGASKDAAAMWYRYQDGSAYGGWQYADIDSTNPCQLNAVMGAPDDNPTTTSGFLASGDDNVPGVILSLASSVSPSGSASLPAADFGLKAPKLSELLPDAASPGNDDTDEFIELYNPNAVAFDLSGFVLQVGSTTSTTRHNYVFPAGTQLPATGFRAFYSSQTHLSLNNTGGQVWLLDPLLNTIAQSDPYSQPKAGNAWAAAGASWYFTTTPTPDAANKINEPSIAAKVTTIAKTTKGAAVTVVAAKTSGIAGASATNTAYDAAAKTTPVHLTALAIVAGLALLYGIYEYRHDIANRIRQFRDNGGTRH